MWIHIPTPGDHYSAATGSAIPTIIYEISRRHDTVGGKTTVIVGRHTRHDYPVGDCVEVDFTRPPSRLEKGADAVCSRLGLGRPFGRAVYQPASRAVPKNFTGPIFVHNSPVALEMVKRAHPRAIVCLWANNQLFRTYTGREVARIAAVTDVFICCSQFIANDLLARLNNNQEKVRVVHNGVDVERFRPALYKPPDAPPTILFVGRVTPVKGPDLLLRAGALVLGTNRRFRIRIVGSSNFNAQDPLTPYEQELRRIAAPLGDAVEFIPFVDRRRVLDEYQAATIFCVPSNWDEPVSLTISEGMACGLPVIASRRGGIPEVGGEAVLYFDPPQVETLADHLAYLIDSPAARADLGHRARKRAESFAWSLQYEQLNRMLEGGAAT